MNLGARFRSLTLWQRLAWGFGVLAAGALLAGYWASRAATPDFFTEQVPQEPPTVVTPSELPHRVIAYYFHTTYRCPSCRDIEAYSREAIEAAFAEELQDGRLVWKAVNIQVKGNEHFVNDYGLYTKSLVLVNEVRGRPAEWKNLEAVWALLQDKPRFLRYVQDETRAYLTAGT